jgi:hypothetical protein
MIGNCRLSKCSARARANRWIGLAVMAGLAACFAGCGDPNTASSLKVYPVKGQVLLSDGKPLTSGRVVLVSTEKAMEFTGEVGSDGNFELKTSYGDGAPEGTYKVRIEYDDPHQAPALKGKPSRRNVSNLPFSPKYTEEATSDLSVTVKPGDNVLEPFKLTNERPAAAAKKGRE